MTPQDITNSVRKKLIGMAVLTTFTALLVTSVGMIVYDLRSFHQSWIDDLTTQANIVAQASATSVAFNDPDAARENLGLLRTQLKILAGAIYTQDGKLFASYVQRDVANPSFPSSPDRPGYVVSGTEIAVFHPIVEKHETIGTVYLRARYDALDRVRNYAGIMVAVAFGSLALATFVASRLQRTITTPILAITNVAHKVMRERDFSQRAPKMTADEIGVLVEAFNSMLAEVERRTEALETSNQALQAEMAVRKDAENALLTAGRLKDEFLATLAHELRNPLAPVNNALQILKMKGDDPATARQMREIMERQIRQMIRLVDDLLDVSRITTGKLMLKQERMNLQDVVSGAVETSRPLIDSRQHYLAIELPATPVFLHGDPVRLAQVISNLLNNAAKYTPAAGRIALTAALEGDRIVIRVVDNGIGVPPELLPRVFDMFVQADHSLERVNSGLGVGLSLAKQLVELHGGTLDVCSDGVDGHGSEFIIRLPAASGNPVAGDAAHPDAAHESHQRILLADDNVDFVDSMADLLTALGYTVHVEYDGEKAISAYREFGPSFAFLDIGLPKVNGYDLVRTLRELSAGRHCVMVAVTGWGQEGDKQRAFEAGFNHHLVKPVSLDNVQAILDA